MVRDFIDESEWPLVVARFPERCTDDEIDAHFGRMSRLLDRGDRFVVVIDLTAVAGVTMRQVARAASHIAKLGPRTRGPLAAVAHVADHGVARGILSLLFWLTPAPFRMRDFHRFDEARAWALERLRSPEERLGATA